MCDSCQDLLASVSVFQVGPGVRAVRPFWLQFNSRFRLLLALLCVAALFSSGALGAVARSWSCAGSLV
jgi:hypothetical protein